MSANLIVDPEQIEREQAKAAEDAAKAAEATTEQGDPAVEPSEDELPEKFRGKSMKDLVDAYRNLETELGRKNNEVGMIRKLADELIGVRATERQMAQENQPKPQPLTTDTLLANPEDAIIGVVRREALSKQEELESKVQTLEERLLTEAFEKKHPGFQQTMVSQEFGTWLQKSEYRKRLGYRAAQGDFEAADELFGLYEEAKAAAPATTTTESRPSARQATLARSGGSAAGGVVPSAEGKKIFTRTELMEMRINRPEEFDQRQEEILAAYREKRVR